MDDEPDLFEELADENAAADDDSDDDDFDLLDQLNEENGTPWYPWEEEDQPEIIQGRVLYVSTVSQDPKYVAKGESGEVPYLEIRDKEDPEFIWSVRGYASVLRGEIEKNSPSAGDFIGIRYLGEEESKGGNVYKKFKVKVIHK